MFGYYAKKLNELIKSEKYKSSCCEYVIQKCNNGQYAIKVVTCTNHYIDLIEPKYKWCQKDKHFKDCLGSPFMVLIRYKKLTKHYKYRKLSFQTL